MKKTRVICNIFTQTHVQIVEQHLQWLVRSKVIFLITPTYVYEINQKNIMDKERNKFLSRIRFLLFPFSLRVMLRSNLDFKNWLSALPKSRLWLNLQDLDI